MRKALLPILMLFVFAVALVVSCQKETVSNLQKDKLSPGPDSEKYELYMSTYTPTTSPEVISITYLQTITTGATYTENAVYHGIGNPDTWDYYKFYGYAGQTVNIQMVRVSCELDAAFTLYYGLSNTTAGLMYYGSSNPNLEYVAFRDDNLDPPSYCDESCFAYWDPNGNITLPYTGWYTIGAYDYIACYGTTSPLTYTLKIDGLTLMIGDCDTYVPNMLVDNILMSEWIADCADGAINHGEYVSCVSHLTNTWKSLGLITGEQKEMIMNCVASSNVP